MKIVLDANFLVDCMRFNTGLIELAGNEVFITDSIMLEIEKLAKGRDRHALPARLALEYVKRECLKELKPKEKNTDLSLLNLSKTGYVIATNDRLLRTRVKKAGGKVMFIRQKKYVFCE